MSLTTSEMTPADLAAVTGNNNNGAFGMDGGAWWIIILFLFVFMGWGGNGWGNNGMNGRTGRADPSGFVHGHEFQRFEKFCF